MATSLPATADREVSASVALACRVLAHNGHDDYVWGHVSVRDPGGRGMWMKGSGLGLGEVGPEDVVLVDPGGTVVAGKRSGHSEWPLHAEVMAARDDVGAVVHTHPPHATALGASGVALRAVSNLGSLFVPPDVARFAATTALIQSREQGRQVASALGERNALLMVDHGIVTAGADVREAVVLAVLLEEACRVQLLTQAFGGVASSAPDHESLRKRETLLSRIAVVWDHFVRQLPGERA